ncbi:polyphosphate polymerase domain-containing protein [Paenibacillus arenilitoris]|uniref:Polyphosphate polymerase domain-containing protein n=1 Tax=Paenibacillus arenilitoris TaxID=2772299 RepID=A0A927CHB8_9BACL|nr:polyphosphate polymerase domain-containing protein [Paenibacillus arenilitoris]MBD2867540.1 polyphosphate polymerase domain-containing protein [Paenibacillus arenilitoris]
MKFLGRKLRHELKYYLHPQEYLTLRQRVSALLPLDSNATGEEGYGIRSLYFDNPRDSALYDKMDGIFRRHKYRIRVYNGSDRIIKLERKNKFGAYVNKESANLAREDYDRILKGDASGLQSSAIPLVQDFYRSLVHEHYRPAAIVDYIREAYVYEHGDVRITFDKRLAAGINTYDLFDPGLILTEALDPTRTILEVKYNEYLPEMIRMLASPHASNRSAISKYVICRETVMQHFKN